MHGVVPKRSNDAFDAKLKARLVSIHKQLGIEYQAKKIVNRLIILNMSDRNIKSKKLAVEVSDKCFSITAKVRKAVQDRW